MSLRVIAPGPLATVQDLGRSGYREFGVPISGAFDRESMAMANAILGNDDDAAAIELTSFGGVFEAMQPMALAIAGATMASRIERPFGSAFNLSVPQSFSLETHDHLILGRASQGQRAYLAVRGGWLTPVVLASRSSDRSLRIGDIMSAESSTTPVRRPSVEWIRTILDEPFRYLDGPDASRLKSEPLDSHTFRVAPLSDRVGIRLEGALIALRDAPKRLSSPVCPGTIQVAGHSPIVLGPDCGTMGGYPHVGQVISADLDRLGQLRPGDSVRFCRVDLVEARALDLASRIRLDECGLILKTAAGWVPK